MKRFLFLFPILLAIIAFLALRPAEEKLKSSEQSIARTPSPETEKKEREIAGIIKKGETLFDIFKKYSLDLAELIRIKEASASVHKLRKMSPGQPYQITIDDENKVCSFTYWINEDSMLSVCRNNGVFEAERKDLQYEKKTGELYVRIKDNLISSIGNGNQGTMVALQLSDIFAWDLDFSTDLRAGDVFKIILEEFYLNGSFRKYGNVLSAEFAGNAGDYRAYRFAQAGKTAYYDEKGRPLKKLFLQAPLSFRRISSTFSRRRLNPVLKIYRPHFGIDYAAPMGTPVSAIGAGTVVQAGRKGGYGKLIVLKHQNGYRTYYGHLSRFAKGIRRGKKVDQGSIIGYVGSTGISTGPHLHFEMRINKKPINPLLAKIPRGIPLSKKRMADFANFRNQMDERLANIALPGYAQEERSSSNEGT